MATSSKLSTKSGLHASQIDISEPTRSRVITLLNQSLATTVDLYTQLKQAHWNVKGTGFYQLHTLFDDIAEEVEAFVDLIAERLTALGGTALGTARIAAQQSLLQEYPLDVFTGPEHIKALVSRMALYAGHIRSAIDTCDGLGEPTTTDLYTQVSRSVDKQLWLLEAHIQA